MLQPYSALRMRAAPLRNPSISSGASRTVRVFGRITGAARSGPSHANISKMQCCRRMTWTVEMLDVRVRDELEALPADRRARFRRIVELDSAPRSRTNAGAACKASGGLIVEGSHERQRRNFSRGVRPRERPARCGG